MKEHLNYILHIASWYPSEVNAYDGDFIQRHIECITEYKHIVIHAQEIPRGNNTIEDGKISQSANNGINEYIVYYKPIVRFANPLYQFFYLLKLWKKIHKEQGLPLLVHVHVLVFSALFAKYLNANYKIPVVATEHSSLYYNEKKSFFDWVKIYFVKHSVSFINTIMPVSNTLGEAMKSLGINNNKIVVPNVVPNYFYNQGLSLPSKEIKFIHVSSLEDSVKNIQGILKAFSYLRQETGNFKLTLVGNFNLEITKTAIASYQLEDIVHLIGPLNHREVATEMAKNDVFVLFSNYENCPCVLIEAQACGLRLISSDVGGVKEIVDPTYDLLVDKGNVLLLKNTLQKMLLQRENVKASIRLRSQKIYSSKSIAEQITSVYKRVLQ